MAKQPRPVGCQVKSQIRKPEIHAQAAAAIGMGTAARTRADDRARIRCEHSAVAGGIHDRRAACERDIIAGSVKSCGAICDRSTANLPSVVVRAKDPPDEVLHHPGRPPPSSKLSVTLEARGARVDPDPHRALRRTRPPRTPDPPRADHRVRGSAPDHARDIRRPTPGAREAASSRPRPASARPLMRVVDIKIVSTEAAVETEVRAEQGTRREALGDDLLTELEQVLPQAGRAATSSSSCSSGRRIPRPRSWRASRALSSSGCTSRSTGRSSASGS